LVAAPACDNCAFSNVTDVREEDKAMALEGKVVLVTGASRGIGKAIAERLSRDDASVVVNYSGPPTSCLSSMLH
jgi:NADP-dependent 3-hydroxy acid dehydrogenase YdfG